MLKMIKLDLCSVRCLVQQAVRWTASKHATCKIKPWERIQICLQPVVIIWKHYCIIAVVFSDAFEMSCWVLLNRTKVHYHCNTYAWPSLPGEFTEFIQKLARNNTRTWFLGGFWDISPESRPYLIYILFSWHVVLLYSETIGQVSRD